MTEQDDQPKPEPTYNWPKVAYNITEWIGLLFLLLIFASWCTGRNFLPWGG